MSFLVHPDYVMARTYRDVYKSLLEEISHMRSTQNVWVALPKEVNRWWRERQEMTLERDGSKWRIYGPGSNRAAVAFACLDGDSVVYEIGRDN
jgi:hypothetical protein